MEILGRDWEATGKRLDGKEKNLKKKFGRYSLLWIEYGTGK